MRRILGDRLPRFSPAESALLKGSSDFYGMNTYTSVYIKEKYTPPDPEDYFGNVEITQIGPDGQPMGPRGESFWLQDGMPLWFRAKIVPWGFRKILNWAWKRYGLPIYLTENGFSIPGENGLDKEKAIDDTARVHFYEGYLNAMLDAINIDGVKVLGYMAWSLLEYSPLRWY